jgi:7-cyano-7-deazaguanine synthase
MEVKHSVIILSWGMDSTTLLYKLIDQWKKVSAISFNYWQRHSKELLFAEESCEKLWVSHKIVDISSITSLISNSSLTSDSIDVPDGHYAEETMKKTVVPNRNMIMASIAIWYAVNIWADEIALGIHSWDHAIYPDCRPEFLDALRAIASIANFSPIGVYAPYVMWVDKGDIVIEWIGLWVDYSLTWTCYKGWEVPCWKCGSCMERLVAFWKARQVLWDDVRDNWYSSKVVFDTLLEQAMILEEQHNW